MQCGNNLKQITLATLNCEQQNRVLPPLCVDVAGTTGIEGTESVTPTHVAGPYQGYIGFSVFCFLLPYIEMGPLYEGSGRDVYGPGMGGPNSTGLGLYNKVISAYRCPDEPSPSANTGMGGGWPSWQANVWAAGNYGANYLVFGNPPAQTAEGATLMSAITDGTSNTIFFAERYAICGNSGDPNNMYTLGTLWADSDPGWRPAFCMNGLDAPPSDPTVRGGYPLCNPFQVAPDWVSGCDFIQAPNRRTPAGSTPAWATAACSLSLKT